MTLSPREVAYPLSEEGLTLEAYLDANDVWTVFGGIAATSGFDVAQFKNRKATLDVALRTTIAWMTKGYVAPVQAAFGGHALTENQMAAAISFEWNTGAIHHADWVKLFVAGDLAAARHDLQFQWTSGGLLDARRARETALFFDTRWPSLICPIREVRHPSFKPGKTTDTDIMPVLQQILGGQ